MVWGNKMEKKIRSEIFKKVTEIYELRKSGTFQPGQEY